MIAPDCSSCTQASRCHRRQKARYHLACWRAMAHEMPQPDCPFHQPLYERGVDGVLSSPCPYYGVFDDQRMS
jgi:hypothetical protein